MACPMVRHAIVDEVQLLPSHPLTPFMYRVVLATVVEASATNIAANEKLGQQFAFHGFLLLVGPAALD
jgi:hypothetical protein